MMDFAPPNPKPRPRPPMPKPVGMHIPDNDDFWVDPPDDEACG